MNLEIYSCIKNLFISTINIETMYSWPPLKEHRLEYRIVWRKHSWLRDSEVDLTELMYIDNNQIHSVYRNEILPIDRVIEKIIKSRKEAMENNNQQEITRFKNLLRCLVIL